MSGAPALPDGYVLHRYDSLDSTNAEALRLVAAGAAPGAVVVADEQTAGRGRAGRRWESPAGNLHLSLVVALPPASRPAAQLAFVAGLSVIDVLGGASRALRLSLKWPNDVLASGRKISGILIEHGGAAVVVGVGINLRHAPPDDTVRVPATSMLAETGRPFDAAAVAAEYCRAFDGRHRAWLAGGFAPLREEWLASAHRMGDTIAATVNGRPVKGHFGGIDEAGALLLEDGRGEIRAISAGDVMYLPQN